METLKIRIKYFEGATKLEKIEKGDWIDVYANADIEIQPLHDTKIPLGFAMQMPEGYEAHLLPRSSTFKKWQVILANNMGIIDNSYCGDNDQWIMAVYCLPKDGNLDETISIHKGDKIGQFRLVEKMPKLEIEEVDVLGNPDRNGFGSTGDR